MKNSKERICSFVVFPDIHFGRKKILIHKSDYFLLPHSDNEVAGKKLEKRLEDSVVGINKSLKTPGISFALSVGDLTESCTREQIEEFKKIMRKLAVPWLPVLGNHDILSYKKGSKPLLFKNFRKYFNREFSKFHQSVREWREQKSEFENITFVYKGVRFVLIDNVSRRKAPFRLPGVIPYNSLRRKSKDWLKECLANKEHTKIVVSHFRINHKFLKKISHRKIIVNISGHMHREKYRKRKNVFSYTLGALQLEPFVNRFDIYEKGVEIHRIEF